MAFQPNSLSYSQGFGSSPNEVTFPHYDVRPPTSTDVLYPVGKRWVDTDENSEYVLTSFSSSQGITSATWVLLGQAAGVLDTLTGDTGGTITPNAGNIDILGGDGITVAGSPNTLTISLTGGGAAIDSFQPDAGTNPVVPDANGLVVMAGTANQITSTGGTNTLTFSIPSAFIAPGSIASTTTVTAGTGLTVTTGNAVVSAGNVTATLGNIAASAGSVSAGTSLAAGTTVTAGTGITATTGNIAASSGNVSASGTVTGGTGVIATTGGLTATAGDITATAGNVLINGAATQLRVHGGAVTDFIGTGTLVAGVATIANTNIAATDRIFLQRISAGASTAIGEFSYSISAATSFTITSLNPTDASTQTNDISTFSYFIVRQTA